MINLNYILLRFVFYKINYSNEVFNLIIPCHVCDNWRYKVSCWYRYNSFMYKRIHSSMWFLFRWKRKNCFYFSNKELSKIHVLLAEEKMLFTINQTLVLWLWFTQWAVQMEQLHLQLLFTNVIYQKMVLLIVNKRKNNLIIIRKE